MPDNSIGPEADTIDPPQKTTAQTAAPFVPESLMPPPVPVVARRFAPPSKRIPWPPEYELAAEPPVPVTWIAVGEVEAEDSVVLAAKRIPMLNESPLMIRLMPSIRIVPVPESMVVTPSTPTPQAPIPPFTAVRLRPRTTTSPPPVETPLVFTLVSMLRVLK